MPSTRGNSVPDTALAAGRAPATADTVDVLRGRPPSDVIDAWRELAVERENLFASPEWQQAWLGAAQGQEPLTLVWRRGVEVAGVLPLVLSSRGPLRLARFPGARRGDWFDPACRRGDEPAMGAAVAPELAGLLGRRILTLHRFDPDSPFVAALSDAWPGARPLVQPLREPDVLPFVELADGYEGWLASRSRNFRSQLRRRRRRLEREHGLRFRLTQRPEELDADLDSFFALQRARALARDRAPTLDTIACAAYRAFARAALARGWLRLWTMELEGRPAGAWYGWRVGRRYCYALSGFDPAWSKLAVGTVLLAHTIERAAAEGCEIYDLMWGDEPYKDRYATGRRIRRSLVVARPGLAERAVIAAARLVSIGARRLPPQARTTLRALGRRARA
ncbi:MAG: GNAT family N-acetyltransferase [Thermoleophilaceae bacterium]|nr:GNAT family N-acetyltransferase [Thermoleophilaceae bacterium]